MSSVPGTQCYEKVVEAFAESSFRLDFKVINTDFLTFLSKVPARVLDAGSDVGQSSVALAERGYSLVQELMSPLLAETHRYTSCLLVL
jgi:hypothetical protein